jgi:hypothetical protein
MAAHATRAIFGNQASSVPAAPAWDVLLSIVASESSCFTVCRQSFDLFLLQRTFDLKLKLQRFDCLGSRPESIMFQLLFNNDDDNNDDDADDQSWMSQIKSRCISATQWACCFFPTLPSRA